jgi:hypothetical protein
MDSVDMGKMADDLDRSVEQSINGAIKSVFLCAFHSKTFHFGIKLT